MQENLNPYCQVQQENGEAATIEQFIPFIIDCSGVVPPLRTGMAPPQLQQNSAFHSDHSYTRHSQQPATAARVLNTLLTSSNRSIVRNYPPATAHRPGRGVAENEIVLLHADDGANSYSSHKNPAGLVNSLRNNPVPANIPINGSDADIEMMASYQDSDMMVESDTYFEVTEIPNGETAAANGITETIHQNGEDSESSRDNSEEMQQDDEVLAGDQPDDTATIFVSEPGKLDLSNRRHLDSTEAICIMKASTQEHRDFIPKGEKNNVAYVLKREGIVNELPFGHEATRRGKKHNYFIDDCGAYQKPSLKTHFYQFEDDGTLTYLNTIKKHPFGADCKFCRHYVEIEGGSGPPCRKTENDRLEILFVKKTGKDLVLIEPQPDFDEKIFVVRKYHAKLQRDIDYTRIFIWVSHCPTRVSEAERKNLGERVLVCYHGRISTAAVPHRNADIKYDLAYFRTDQSVTMKIDQALAAAVPSIQVSQSYCYFETCYIIGTK
jgi:hypothetical protein